MALYLGIDIGTTAVKALALDERGRALACASREYCYYTPAPGWVEQEAEDWWRLLVECVREVVGQEGGPVRAVALSTQGDTMVPLDAAGRPLARARTWMDTRSLAQATRMEAEADLWFRTTGSHPAPYAAATSLMWWHDCLPEVFDAAARFALVADFLVARLTGEAAVDAPNASRTMLYDIGLRDWSAPLLERVGVGRERLAGAAESGTIVGPLRPEAAAALGLSPNCRVVLGGHDRSRPRSTSPCCS